MRNFANVISFLLKIGRRTIRETRLQHWERFWLELRNSNYWNRNSTNAEVERPNGLLILCFLELVCWSTPLCCGQPLKHTSIYFLDVVLQKNKISCIWNLGLLSFVHHMLCLHINIFILFEYMEITLFISIMDDYCEYLLLWNQNSLYWHNMFQFREYMLHFVCCFF
jgi:hypothetical protein